MEELSRLGNGLSRLGYRLVDYSWGQFDYIIIVCVFKAFNNNSKNTHKYPKSSSEVEQLELCINA